MGGLQIAYARAPVMQRAARRQAAWGLLRGLLAGAGHEDPVLSNPCPRCGGPHGPVLLAEADGTPLPWLAGVAYAGGYAVAAVHPRGAGAGAVTAFAIDAEPLVDAVRDAAGGAPGGILRWVRTEAVLKARARGLRIDPADVEIAEAQTADVDLADLAPGWWRARVAGAPARFVGAEPSGALVPPGILVSVALSRDPAAAAASGRPAMPRGAG